MTEGNTTTITTTATATSRGRYFYYSFGWILILFCQCISFFLLQHRQKYGGILFCEAFVIIQKQPKPKTKTTVTTNTLQFPWRKPEAAAVATTTCHDDSSTSTFSTTRLYETTPSQQRISDPPLASYIKDTTLVTDYTLAETPEDYIDLKIGQRLVCIGDVHGDYEALKEFLFLAEVYDEEKDRWCGNNTIVVQCGDVLDRGSQELKCYRLLAKLSHEASIDGGNVIVLLGNHEILNAMGLFQYATTDQEYEEIVGPVVDKKLNTSNWRMQYVNNQPSRWATYEPGGLLANALMSNMKVAVQVGRTVCVHAGLTAGHILFCGGIHGMNQKAKEWLLYYNNCLDDDDNDNNDDCDDDDDDDINKMKHDVTYNNMGSYGTYQERLTDATNRQESYINTVPDFLNGGIGVSSPIWMRDYTSPNDMPPKNPNAQTMINEALDSIDNDAVRMVMGHTVQKRINSALGGKAWRIDVGASRGVINGSPEVLEIVATKDKEEVVSVLTKTGKVPARERETLSILDMFF